MKFVSNKSQPKQKLPQSAPASRNASPGASSKGFTPPQGKPSNGMKLSQHPPLPGAHKMLDIQIIPGGHNAGGSQIHPSLRKGK